MTDLDRLIAAVEAGEPSWNRLASIAEDAMPPKEAALAATANKGSLDAALALKDALLPGWRVGNLAQASACPTDSPDYWKSWIVSPSYLDDCQQAQATAPTPARALLLAVLRAHAATQEPTP